MNKFSKYTYINSTILDNEPSGLGIYAINVLKRISKYLKFSSNIVFTSADIVFNGLDISKTSKLVRPSDNKYAGIFRFFWTQIILPLKIMFKQGVIYCPNQYASLLSNKKQIITIHDLLPLHFPKQNKLQFLYYKYFLPLLLRRSEKIITISENTKKDIINYYRINENKIEVIYNGYDSNLFFPRDKEGYVKKTYNIKKYILIVGASYPHKNIDKYFEAFATIKNKIEESIVIVGGRKQYKEYLKEVSKKLNIEDRVVFLPYILDKDLPKIYSEASVLVYPTLYEGFGLPPIEAMACGTPTIVSNTSSLPEVVGNASLLFDPYSINDMAEKTLQILTNEEMKEYYIKEGYKNIQRFSWDKTAKNIAKVIIEINE